MIAHVQGRVNHYYENICIVDNNGIGYEIFCTEKDLNYIIKNEIKDVTFYTKLIHKDDGMELYGFLNRTDLAIFKLLLIVKGIGPKQAIKILNHERGENILRAIYGENREYLHKIVGISKKKAEQIIIELKERIKKSFDIGEVTKEELQGDQEYIDAVKALENLGFTRQEIDRAMEKLNISAEKLKAEEIIERVLKEISSI